MGKLSKSWKRKWQPKLIKAKDLKEGMRIEIEGTHSHMEITAIYTDSVKISAYVIGGKRTFYKEDEIKVWDR